MPSDKITATYKRRRSSAIIQTNPRLTGNIKLAIDSNDVYLELIPSNDKLQTRRFTTRPLNVSVNDFSQDVYNMLAEIPQETLFAVEDIQTEQRITRLSEQRPTLYNYGVRPCTSRFHSEQFRAFAPLYISERLPRYFVVFTLDGIERHITNENDLTKGESYTVMDGSVTEILYDGNNEREKIVYERGETFVYQKDVRTYRLDSARLFPTLFDYKVYLDQARILTVFDLHESKLGTYLQKLVNNERFGLPPIDVDFKAKRITYNGISTRRGGFVSAVETLDEFYRHEYPVFEFDRHITDGFARNGLIVPQILNLEFLFDDDRHGDFTFNRYFGMYCDDTLGKVDFTVTDLNKIAYPQQRSGFAYVKNLTTGRFSSVYKDKNKPKIAIVDKKEVIDTTPLPETTVTANALDRAVLAHVFQLPKRKPGDAYVPLLAKLVDSTFTITEAGGTDEKKAKHVMGRDEEWLKQQGLLGDDRKQSSRDLSKYGCWETSANEAVFLVTEDPERTYKNLTSAINAVYKSAHFDFVYDGDTLFVYTGISAKNVIIRHNSLMSSYGLKSMTMGSPVDVGFTPTLNDRRGFWIKSADEPLFKTVTTNDPLKDDGTWLLGKTGQLVPVRYKTFGIEPRQFKLHKRSRQCKNLGELLTSNVGIYADLSPLSDVPIIEPKVHLFRRPKFEFGFFDLCPVRAFDVSLQQPYTDTLWNEYFFYYNTQPDQLIASENYAVFSEEPYTIELYDVSGSKIKDANGNAVLWTSAISGTNIVNFYVAPTDIGRYKITSGNPRIILKKLIHDNELVYYSGLFNQINRNYSQSTIVINYNINFDRSIYTVKEDKTSPQFVPYKVIDENDNTKSVNFLVRNRSMGEQSLITKYHWRFQEILKTDGINEYSRFNDVERARRYLLHQPINKWVMAERSAKENPIRLSLSSRHGETAELPTLEHYSANSLYSSLEWFALSRFPAVYPKDKIESSRHYFTRDFNHQDHINDTNDDYFTRYFTVYKQKGVDMPFQERFSYFKQVKQNTYQATHRGVRYEIYDENRSYDGYRFATVLNRQTLDDAQAFDDAVGAIKKRLEAISPNSDEFKALKAKIDAQKTLVDNLRSDLSNATTDEQKAEIRQRLYANESLLEQLEGERSALGYEGTLLSDIKTNLENQQIHTLNDLILEYYDTTRMIDDYINQYRDLCQKLMSIGMKDENKRTKKEKAFYNETVHDHITKASSWCDYIDTQKAVTAKIAEYEKSLDKQRKVINDATSEIATQKQTIESEREKLERMSLTTTNTAEIKDLQDVIATAISTIATQEAIIATAKSEIDSINSEIDSERNRLQSMQTVYQLFALSWIQEVSKKLSDLESIITNLEDSLQRLCYQISINDQHKTICLSVNVDLKDYKSYIEAVLDENQTIIENNEAKTVRELQHELWAKRDEIAKHPLVKDKLTYTQLKEKWEAWSVNPPSSGTKEDDLFKLLKRLDYLKRVIYELKHESKRHTLDYVYLYAMNSIKEYNYEQDDYIFPYDYVPNEAYAKGRYDRLQQKLTASEAYRVLLSGNYKTYRKSTVSSTFPRIQIVFPDRVDITQSLQSVAIDGTMTHSDNDGVSLRRYSGGFYPSVYDLLTFDCLGDYADLQTFDDVNVKNKVNLNVRRLTCVDVYQRRFDTTDNTTDTIEASQECLFQNTLRPVFIKHDPKTKTVDLRDDFRLDLPTFLNNVGIKLPETIETSGDPAFVSIKQGGLRVDYKKLIGDVAIKLLNDFRYDPKFCKRLTDEIYGLYRISSCKLFTGTLPVKDDNIENRFYCPSPRLTRSVDSSLIALGFSSVSTCNIKTDPVNALSSISSSVFSDPLSCFAVSVSLTLL
jgi:hypothetical protein